MKVTRSDLRTVAVRVAAGLTERGTPLAVLPLVGLQEINRMFGYAKHTSYQLRSREVLPTEDDTISGHPMWKLPTIYAWAADTDREIIWDPWGLVASDGAAAPSN